MSTDVAGPDHPEPIAGRARAAERALYLAIAVAVLVAVLDIIGIGKIDDFIENPSPETAQGLEDRDSLSGTGGLLTVLSYIVCAVFFIRWLNLAYRNLDRLAPGARRYGEGWSIGAWFVPILNLFRPKQIVNDVARGTGHVSFGLLAWWWGLWLAASAVGNGAGRAIWGADTPQDFKDADTADAVAQGFGVVAGVLAIMVVRQVSAAYERRIGERAVQVSAEAQQRAAGMRASPERPQGAPAGPPSDPSGGGSGVPPTWAPPATPPTPLPTDRDRSGSIPPPGSS